MPKRDQSYRLRTATLAITILDGHNCPTTIPGGAVIKVADGPMEGNRLVGVTWESKTLMMFTTDIRERGVRLEDY